MPFITFLLISCSNEEIAKGLEVSNSDNTFTARYFNVGSGGAVGTVTDFVNIQETGEDFDDSKNIIFRSAGAMSSMCLTWLGTDQLEIGISNHSFDKNKGDVIIGNTEINISLVKVAKENCKGIYGSIQAYGKPFKK
ncbi:hypothetical protein DKW60_00575 [Leucothrix pacifica]|uniref:Uncharacterized protein n=2 Tax=Leucothrix pacifica TaxID=1247513 RepID=A0A317CPW5_9GAMM|nr:hypothetical protein DKW60_00575 [Leucothrix pacifica]